ncbi:Acetylcholine receptor subunit alpha-like 1 [Melipona quadrifasciata]|uniref:Acetylcholine receptor subunit alpha-like 1 n=1 Tax=Melipona quadrifasciata TaxID=166423 RepID=A0A0N0BE06_9HYME|nr:Acetylcholine receptor subunit alpha-like 1 [Melipona quadrifasciata]
MLRDAWSNDGGKGWWRWWSRLGGLLAMATAISCLVAPFPGASANPEAKRLYDDLLSNYNRLIRPVGNNSDRLTVKMGLRLSQLIDVFLVQQLEFMFNLQRIEIKFPPRDWKREEMWRNCVDLQHVRIVNLKLEEATMTSMVYLVIKYCLKSPLKYYSENSTLVFLEYYSSIIKWKILFLYSVLLNTSSIEI